MLIVYPQTELNLCPAPRRGCCSIGYGAESSRAHATADHWRGFCIMFQHQGQRQLARQEPLRCFPAPFQTQCSERSRATGV